MTTTVVLIVVAVSVCFVLRNEFIARRKKRTEKETWLDRPPLSEEMMEELLERTRTGTGRLLPILIDEIVAVGFRFTYDQYLRFLRDAECKNGDILLITRDVVKYDLLLQEAAAKTVQQWLLR